VNQDEFVPDRRQPVVHHHVQPLVVIPELRDQNTSLHSEDPGEFVLLVKTSYVFLKRQTGGRISFYFLWICQTTSCFIVIGRGTCQSNKHAPPPEILLFKL